MKTLLIIIYVATACLLTNRFQFGFALSFGIGSVSVLLALATDTILRGGRK